MKKLFVILFLGMGIFALFQLPVVTGSSVKEVKNALAAIEPIELSGKTLFISDLHLTEDPALEEQFNLDFSEVRNVIIVGDFFNWPGDFWSFGNSEEEAFGNVLGRIVPENFSGNIFFIHAATHDPQRLKIQRISFENFEFYHIGEFAKFDIGGTKVVAFHGTQLHSGMIGGGIAWLAKKFGVEVPLERLGKKRFGVAKDTWVINGHSHVPGIDQGAKAGNTGSFVGAPFNRYVFRIHVGTGILFDHDRVELQEYEGLNLKKLYASPF